MKGSLVWPLSLAAVLLSSIGCYPGIPYGSHPDSGTGSTADACVGIPPAALDQIYVQQLEPSLPTGCAVTGCHASGAGGLQFDNAHALWQSTVGVPSTSLSGIARVSPGDPEHSALYKSLQVGAAGRMPPGGPYLDDAALAEVAGWICAGAPEPSLPPATDGGTDGGADAGGSFELLAVTPTSVMAGSGAVTLTLDGRGFLATSAAHLGGSALVTTYVSATQLKAAVGAATTASATNTNITVANGTTLTGARSFEVDNPLPVLSTLSPTQAPVNGAPFTLTLDGTGFNPASKASFDGTPVTTAFVSATRLTLAVPTLTSARNYPVTVANPSPGGGASATLNLAVVAITGPVITGLSPNPAQAGAAFTLLVSGAGYVCGGTSSTVLLNGATLSPTACTATQLQVSATALVAGSYPVQVKDPSGQLSTAVNLSVVAPNPVPTLASLSPSSAPSGSAALTLTATGTGFVSGAELRLNGSARTTTFVSPTQLTATVPGTDLATATTWQVTAFNPAPGGGTSNQVGFPVVQSNPVPAITGLTPCGTAAGGGSFSLTVAGTGFAAGATLTFNGTAVTVSSTTATQIGATVPAALIASAPSTDVVSVVVTNPAPGGGASAPATFGLASAVATLAGKVQPIFTASCASAQCHSGGSVPMVLTAGQTYADTVGVACAQCPPKLRVSACKPTPADSYLIAKIQGTGMCTGSRMPKGASSFTAADARAVLDWVAQGAPP